MRHTGKLPRQDCWEVEVSKSVGMMIDIAVDIQAPIVSTASLMIGFQSFGL
jgi:hypothetical protein